MQDRLQDFACEAEEHCADESDKDTCDTESEEDEGEESTGSGEDQNHESCSKNCYGVEMGCEDNGSKEESFLHGDEVGHLTPDFQMENSLT